MRTPWNPGFCIFSVSFKLCLPWKNSSSPTKLVFLSVLLSLQGVFSSTSGQHFPFRIGSGSFLCINASSTKILLLKQGRSFPECYILPTVLVQQVQLQATFKRHISDPDMKASYAVIGVLTEPRRNQKGSVINSNLSFWIVSLARRHGKSTQLSTLCLENCNHLDPGGKQTAVGKEG